MSNVKKKEECPDENEIRIKKLWMFLDLYNQETKKLYSNDSPHKTQSTVEGPYGYASNAEGIGCIQDCLDLAKDDPILYNIALKTARKVNDIMEASSQPKLEI